jgi:hypothetical protein
VETADALLAILILLGAGTGATLVCALPAERLVPGALVVWEPIVMTMPATRFLAITVTGAAVLGGSGDHRLASINGNHGG